MEIYLVLLEASTVSYLAYPKQSCDGCNTQFSCSVVLFYVSLIFQAPFPFSFTTYGHSCAIL